MFYKHKTFASFHGTPTLMCKHREYTYIFYIFALSTIKNNNEFNTLNIPELLTQTSKLENKQVYRLKI